MSRVRNILLLLCCALSISAQMVTIPFLNSFEQNETQVWTLNDGADEANDKWVTGQAVRSDGRQGLYISNDSGMTATYGDKPNTVIAYRRLKFPSDTAATQHYDLSFDWKNAGLKGFSELYVYFGPEQNLPSLTASSTSGDALSSAALNSMLPLGTGGAKALCEQTTWQNVLYQIGISKQNASRFTFVLAFVWVNRNTNEEVIKDMPIGACIDNIQMCYSKAPRPTNFTAEVDCEDGHSGMKLSWNSVLEDFVLEFREANSERWSKINGLVANDIRDAYDGTKYNFQIEQMKEGLYEFRIRGILGQDSSSYAYLRELRLFCWDNHCIKYIDFYGDNVECRYGKFSSPDTEVGVIDYGEYERESRHTVCAHKGEYDPLTVGEDGKGLLKVPDDCMASVRLGNWKTGAEEESVSYTLTIDSTENSILIVRYAIVFQDPAHYDRLPNEFHLDILDADNYPIDELCGRAYFRYVPDDVDEWNDWSYSGLGKGKWKDWTIIGLNLSELHGRDVKIRISTYDCGQGGHFTYAYYVMDCTNAKLMTETCGDIPIINVEAPDGFNYTWTNEQGQFVSHNRRIEIGQGDRQRYTCNVCYKESDDCCFQLSTALSPRYPFAEYNMSYQPSRCRNTIHFNNLSHVIMVTDTMTEHLRDESCESYMWQIQSLKHPEAAPTMVSLPNPTYNCDVSGDKLEVRLTAFLAEETCADVRVDTINVPSILTADQTDKKTICEGNAVMFADEYRTESGLYSQKMKNMFGCDSVVYLDLTVNPKSEEQFISDTICSDGVYHLDSLVYSKTGNYEVWLRNMWGCDSIINLDLTVLKKLSVEVEEIPTICADGEKLTINFNIADGGFDSVAVRFTGGRNQLKDTVIRNDGQEYVQIPYPVDIQPDHYSATIEFYQHKSCENQVFTLPFDINYRSSIIVQRWNDVLGIQNRNFNGGYEFLSYQWYKEGEPIEGATMPYLYVESGLEIGAQYSAQVVRDDNVMLFICPVTVVDQGADENIPTLLFGGQQLPRQSKGIARWVSQIGRLEKQQQYNAGEAIVVPSEVPAGYYVLSVAEDERSIVRKVYIQHK